MAINQQSLIEFLSVQPDATFGDLLLDLTGGIDTGVSVRNALRGIAATLMGKVSGAGTGTVIFRNLNDTKDVVTATCDALGNRGSITRDLT